MPAPASRCLFHRPPTSSKRKHKLAAAPQSAESGGAACQSAPNRCRAPSRAGGPLFLRDYASPAGNATIIGIVSNGPSCSDVDYGFYVSWAGGISGPARDETSRRREYSTLHARPALQGCTPPTAGFWSLPADRCAGLHQRDPSVDCGVASGAVTAWEACPPPAVRIALLAARTRTPAPLIV